MTATPPSQSAAAAPLKHATLTPNPTVASPIPSAITVDAQALRGIVLEFAHPWGAETARAISQITEEFNRENAWGIRVQISAAPGSAAMLFEQINAAQPAERPSLVAAPISHLVYWHENGNLLVDLTPYEMDPAWGLSPRELDDFFAPIFAQELVNGQRLGFPAERTARIMFYNATWAKELGFDNPPETPAEFQQQVCAAAQANVTDRPWQNDGTGGWIIDRNANTLASWMLAFGAKLPMADMQDYRFESSETSRAFTYLRELFDKNCAWFSRNPQPYEYFATRQSLLYSGDLSEIKIQQFYLTRLASTDAWTVMPFPGENGMVLPVSGLSYSVMQSAPAEQLAAWLFIRWLALPRNQALMVRSGGTLPLSKSALTELAAYARENPQWNAIVTQMDALRPAPSAANWRLAGGVLEDAAWQLLQPTPLPADSILQQLDDTISEIQNRQP